MEPPSCGTNTGAGPKNISRHSRLKRRRFPVSVAVRGFTMGKCGLLPQHFHHSINVAVVMLLFFSMYLLFVALCLRAKNDNNDSSNSSNKVGCRVQ